jgi:hypothetical protein
MSSIVCDNVLRAKELVVSGREDAKDRMFLRAFNCVKDEVFCLYGGMRKIFGKDVDVDWSMDGISYSGRSNCEYDWILFVDRLREVIGERKHHGWICMSFNFVGRSVFEFVLFVDLLEEDCLFEICSVGLSPFIRESSKRIMFFESDEMPSFCFSGADGYPIKSFVSKQLLRFCDAMFDFSEKRLLDFASYWETVGVVADS